MNGNVPAAGSEAVPEASPGQSHRDTVEYIGFRVDGQAVVLNLSEHRRLSLERSLDLVNHSPSGFEWGYSGSGPAQLACALLLDYYDDEQFAREHYITFRNQVVSQLECDGAAACWHLPGEEINAAMATLADDVVALADGGRPSPTLPENWRAVSRQDRRVFQRADRDHYIVLGDGTDELVVVLCSQGDRAYPAPLAHRTVAEEADVEQVIQELAEESNDLIEPLEGEH
ncbi:hypothetical protein JMJ58_24260 (plasmid) [Haloterrigena salifodinae]|uniref:Uncharacterized protein n=1 Tax=Haloterrigena salifodinae TaxID=2675099 RepID=A0A8T8E9C5_9EURY|nr:DUF6166 domain-containing protein [Haloterrigena salifodinae]QRV18041.1 hypothetical protein JMJ58_24260 [Haloterrigena salifodinae]